MKNIKILLGMLIIPFFGFGQIAESFEMCIVTGVLGGSGDYSLEWTDGETDECFTPTQAGEYCLTVTDNGTGKTLTVCAECVEIPDCTGLFACDKPSNPGEFCAVDESGNEIPCPNGICSCEPDCFDCESNLTWEYDAQNQQLSLFDITIGSNVMANGSPVLVNQGESTVVVPSPPVDGKYEISISQEGCGTCNYCVEINIDPCENPIPPVATVTQTECNQTLEVSCPSGKCQIVFPNLYTGFVYGDTTIIVNVCSVENGNDVDSGFLNDQICGIEGQNVTYAWDYSCCEAGCTTDKECSVLLRCQQGFEAKCIDGDCSCQPALCQCIWEVAGTGTTNPVIPCNENGELTDIEIILTNCEGEIFPNTPDLIVIADDGTETIIQSIGGQEFDFSGLPPGDYAITVDEAEGCSSLFPPNIIIQDCQVDCCPLIVDSEGNDVININTTNYCEDGIFAVDCDGNEIQVELYLDGGWKTTIPDGDPFPVSLGGNTYTMNASETPCSTPVTVILPECEVTSSTITFTAPDGTPIETNDQLDLTNWTFNMTAFGGAADMSFNSLIELYDWINANSPCTWVLSNGTLTTDDPACEDMVIPTEQVQQEFCCPDNPEKIVVDYYDTEGSSGFEAPRTVTWLYNGTYETMQVNILDENGLILHATTDDAGQFTTTDGNCFFVEKIVTENGLNHYEKEPTYFLPDGEGGSASIGVGRGQNTTIENGVCSFDFIGEGGLGRPNVATVSTNFTILSTTTYHNGIVVDSQNPNPANNQSSSSGNIVTANYTAGINTIEYRYVFRITDNEGNVLCEDEAISIKEFNVTCTE